MRNIETLSTKTGPDDAGLNILLTEARLEERRARAEAMAARLDSLACHITSRQLTHVEAAELLRVTAEAMDLVQQRVEEERQRHIRAARAKTPGVSRVLCIDCEAPIPPARRRAIPGVQLCITCQEIAELKGKHYNGGAV